MQCRRVFVLRKVYGYSQKEIAQALGISYEALQRKAEAAAAYAEYLKLAPQAADADAKIGAVASHARDDRTAVDPGGRIGRHLRGGHREVQEEQVVRGEEPSDFGTRQPPQREDGGQTPAAAVTALARPEDQRRDDQGHQHLAALFPRGNGLVLNLLRWGGEIRSWQSLDLPPLGVKEAGIREPELKMAKALIEDMTAHWSPDQFRDTFHEQVMKLVEDKAAGCPHAIHVRSLPVYDFREALRPATRPIHAEETEYEEEG
mgnify:CR=1 FL=1